jgi:hypothetical protein
MSLYGSVVMWSFTLSGMPDDDGSFSGRRRDPRYSGGAPAVVKSRASCPP